MIPKKPRMILLTPLEKESKVHKKQKKKRGGGERKSVEMVNGKKKKKKGNQTKKNKIIQNNRNYKTLYSRKQFLQKQKQQK